MFSIRFKWQWLVKLTVIFTLAVPTVCSAAVVARMQTSLGIIDVQLYDTKAPLTVANFLSYAKSGAYANSIIHRSVPGFIIQGGGFAWNDTTNQLSYVATNPPVMNEYSADRSNLRGTIAMAKQGSDPNSATNQWFFNLADNSANLDLQNGGFTVFGQVLNAGMGVVDAIAALPRVNAGKNTPFETLPYLAPITNNTVQKSNMVIVERVSVLVPAKTRAADRVFAYLESLYPERFSPANSVGPNSKSTTGSGYYYRYYAKTQRYIAAANGKVYWGSALGNTLKSIGTLNNLLSKASALGY
ncbi:MAG: peptidylprolyl isomerase [Methylobacter sp.]|nr:MAG: peptidylprolyl isomerase [Methylobacter sp.]